MKIIRVEKCIDCPSSEFDYGRFWCRKLKQHVNPHFIHPDCPFEDAKETDDGQEE